MCSGTILGQQNLLKQKQEEAFQLIFTNQDKAIVIIDSLIEANKNNLDFKQGKNFSNKGVYYAVKNQLDSAAVYFNKAIELTPKDHQFYPKLLNNLSIVHKKKGEYIKAIETLDAALQIANSRDNKDAKSKIYSELSSVYRSLEKYNLAVKYSLQAIEIINTKYTVDAYALNNEKQKLANLYRALDNNVFAIQLYEEILPYFENAIYTDSRISTYINYAASLINVSEFDKAKVLLTKAKNELVNFKNKELFAFYKLTYALYYKKTGELSKAESCFEIALSNFENHLDNYPKTLNEYLSFLQAQNKFDKLIDFVNSDKKIDNMQVGFQDLVDYHGVLGLAFEKTGDYQTSLYHYKNKIRYSDSLSQQNNFAIAKDLQAKYQNKILSQKNNLLQQENIIQGKTNLIVLITSISLIIIFSILLIRYKNRVKAAKKHQELSDQKIKAEEKLIEIKDALLKEQKKELLSRSFEINKLNKDIQFIKKNMGAENEMVKQRLNDVDQFISPKHEIDKLRYEFERVYPNFYQDIKKMYPKLNKNDALFLSFVKLKFTYKEIANILNITHKSAITKKYRIAKKMNLDNNEDFYEFVEKKL
ncbi:tetratricopeptide repeat protein [Psychroflexus planctonicus]|uniref:Tetratricopeptide repeat-containing protein n=1 Tax=Psychroflexus planctonicus TaxID=1526575 RepID=A0ABQ1SEL1_9FLAO|nr:tetratricopeptide repeat protein [Psychroflexus planctonicus]GGE26595.1 hypothetical protein GCM10010832_04110 [Psychroflexus planctonicus]